MAVSKRSVNRMRTDDSFRVVLYLDRCLWLNGYDKRLHKLSRKTYLSWILFTKF